MQPSKGIRCFLLLVFIVLPAASASDMISSRRKSSFIQHLNSFLSNLVGPTDNDTTPAPVQSTAAPTTTPRRSRTTSPPASSSRTAASSSSAMSSGPIVVRPFENPAAAVSRYTDSLTAALNLQQTIAPPAVRPCFVRPAFCPATSDACSKSRCARLYANGVRIGSRFYKRVKCRLNYCRETCGKAEWFADGRRLIGCSDSSSTIDSPIWSVQRVYPRLARLDSRVVPVERVASPRPSPTSSAVTSAPRAGQPQRREVQSYIGSFGEKISNATQDLGDAIKRTLEEKRKQVLSAFSSQTTPAAIKKLMEEGAVTEPDPIGTESVDAHITEEKQHGPKSSAPSSSIAVNLLWPVLAACSLFFF